MSESKLQILDNCIRDNQDLFFRSGWTYNDYREEIIKHISAGHENIAIWLISELDGTDDDYLWEVIAKHAVEYNRLEVVKTIISNDYIDEEMVEELSSLANEKGFNDIVSILETYAGFWRVISLPEMYNHDLSG